MASNWLWACMTPGILLLTWRGHPGSPGNNARLSAVILRIVRSRLLQQSEVVYVSLDVQAALMALGLPEDIAEILANEDIEYPLLAERIVAVGFPPSAPAHMFRLATISSHQTFVAAISCVLPSQRHRELQH